MSQAPLLISGLRTKIKELEKKKNLYMGKNKGMNNGHSSE